MRRTNAQDGTFFLGQTRHGRQQERQFAAARRVGHDLSHCADRKAAPGQESVEHGKVGGNAGRGLAGSREASVAMGLLHAEPHMIAHDRVAGGKLGKKQRIHAVYLYSIFANAASDF